MQIFQLHLKFSRRQKTIKLKSEKLKKKIFQQKKTNIFENQCYIKCYLEKVGILLADANLNRDRAIEMQWSTSDDSLDDCVKESRSQ